MPQYGARVVRQHMITADFESRALCVLGGNRERAGAFSFVMRLAHWRMQCGTACNVGALMLPRRLGCPCSENACHVALAALSWPRSFDVPCSSCLRFEILSLHLFRIQFRSSSAPALPMRAVNQDVRDVIAEFAVGTVADACALRAAST